MNITKQNQTHRSREQAWGYWWEREARSGLPQGGFCIYSVTQSVGRSGPSGPVARLLLQPERGREETNSWGQAGKEDEGTLPSLRRNRSCLVDVKPVWMALRGLTSLVFKLIYFNWRIIALYIYISK